MKENSLNKSKDDHSEIGRFAPESILTHDPSREESDTFSSLNPAVPLNNDSSIHDFSGSENSIVPKPIGNFSSLKFSDIQKSSLRNSSSFLETSDNVINDEINNDSTLKENIKKASTISNDNKKNKILAEMFEKKENGLFPIFIISKENGNKCFYVNNNLKFKEVIEEYKKVLNGKDISTSNFKYNDVYVDPNKTIVEINIKPYAKINLC